MNFSHPGAPGTFFGKSLAIPGPFVYNTPWRGERYKNNASRKAPGKIE